MISPLLRSDIADLSPTSQLSIVEDAIEKIVAKEPANRSHIEKEELPKLIDMQSHLELNLQKAKEQHPFTPKSSYATCAKCGHRMPLEQ